MKLMATAGMGVVLGALALLPMAARAEGLDKRITEALEAEDLKYDVQDDGDVSVVIEFVDDNNRTQQVIMQSKTFSFKQTEFREIFSAAMRFDANKGLDGKIATRLLDESSRSSLGFWGVEDGVVYSIARIPAKAPPSTLHEAISFVASRADDLEKELQGGDEF